MKSYRMVICRLLAIHLERSEAPLQGKGGLRANLSLGQSKIGPAIDWLSEGLGIDGQAAE
ncbi:hypothetical protein SAMN02745746_02701 [Pseudogulbenkiania subflava DSM 22618]|uniref:Uncharacterized protein n=1 Tax=Pseudogulbenkiania subflava DSM 22618 TaxID=1123014 RepID=A0A1Y6BYR7_9NEIS|nr:hypothetical protein SAMN02745746_02701 [Pseudogulbenkiania subflava DSM 22618]